MSIYLVNGKYISDVKDTKSSSAGSFGAKNNNVTKPIPQNKTRLELDLEAQGMLGRSQIIYKNAQNQNISFGKTENNKTINPLKPKEDNPIKCEIDKISDCMPDLSNGAIKKAKNFLKRDEIGNEREFEGYTIKKISNTEVEITKKVQEPPQIQQEPKTIEEMVEAILACGTSFKNESAYKNFEAEILALAGTDESKIELIYDTLAQTPDGGLNSNVLEVINGLSKYKSARFILFNTLLRKSKSSNPDDPSFSKILDKYSDDDINGAWRQIKKLQKFLDNFDIKENTELFRTDRYDIFENVEINSGAYKGRNLAEILQNHASGKEKIDLEELSNSLQNQDIVQEGFLSTSIIELGAKDGEREKRPILWKFKTQGKTKGCYIDLFGKSLSQEYECLINTRAKINIENITQDDEGKWVIEATVTNDTK